MAVIECVMLTMDAGTITNRKQREQGSGEGGQKKASIFNINSCAGQIRREKTTPQRSF
jgi:hypothetical protein